MTHVLRTRGFPASAIEGNAAGSRTTAACVIFISVYLTMFKVYDQTKHEGMVAS